MKYLLLLFLMTGCSNQGERLFKLSQNCERLAKLLMVDFSIEPNRHSTLNHACVLKHKHKQGIKKFIFIDAEDMTSVIRGVHLVDWAVINE